MKVLTIKQPWATLIMQKDKRFEFRSWQTKYRGDLLIHAGKGIDKEAMKRLDKYIPEDMPIGKILGKVRLVDCVKMSPEFKEILLKENKDIYTDSSFKENYGWQIEEVEVFEKPIEAKGKLSLWEYDYTKRENMRNIDKYYENTKDAIPNKNIKEFMELKLKPQNAIELGCGAGRDTSFLIENGWKVLAIDREDVSSIIIKKLKEEQLNKFRFKKQNFENLELEDNNLIVANYSLSFCNKENFSEMWNKINNSILPSGYFVGNFFGLNDEWKKVKKDMTFLSKENVLRLSIILKL